MFLKLEQEQRALKLKAKHAKSEARQTLEAAEVELNVWSEIDDDEHLSSRLAPTSGQYDTNAKSDEHSFLHVSKPRGKSPSVLSLAYLCKLRYLLSLYVCQSRHCSLSLINSHYVTYSSFSDHNCPDFHSDIALLPQAISKSKSSDFFFAAIQPQLVLSQQSLASVADSFAQPQSAQACHSVPETATYTASRG